MESLISCSFFMPKDVESPFQPGKVIILAFDEASYRKARDDGNNIFPVATHDPGDACGQCCFALDIAPWEASGPLEWLCVQECFDTLSCSVRRFRCKNSPTQGFCGDLPHYQSYCHLASPNYHNPGVFCPCGWKKHICLPGVIFSRFDVQF